MSLASMMRRLMTGYAVWHNRRYDRKGHLFQNRYRSIIVEEDSYFLELVRYVHLNPVRAGIIDELTELDKYLHTGHAVIMGNRDFSYQDTEAVLRWFGRRIGQARRQYRSFVEAKFDQGYRDDLRKGGVRSGVCELKKSPKQGSEEHGLRDSRILGGGEFAGRVLRSHNQSRGRERRDVEDVLEEICALYDVPRAQILSRSRIRKVSHARRRFLLLAHEQTGASMAALGRLCGLSHTASRKAIATARRERSHDAKGSNGSNVAHPGVG
jgi:hypothetical protein